MQVRGSSKKYNEYGAAELAQAAAPEEGGGAE
jgi:hypothetical protein